MRQESLSPAEWHDEETTSKTLEDGASDAELIKRLVGGDREACAEIWRRHSRAIHNFLRGYLPQEADIEDIKQEVFLILLEKGEQYRADAALRSWLTSIAKNCALNVMQRGHTKMRRNTVSLDENPWTAEESLLMKEEGGPAIVEREETRYLIYGAIGQLPDYYQDVILMRYVAGMEYQEIAESLDIPLGTVRSRLHKAKMCLRMFLEEVDVQSAA